MLVTFVSGIIGYGIADGSLIAVFESPQGNFLAIALLVTFTAGVVLWMIGDILKREN